jgi:hypothetical protein
MEAESAEAMVSVLAINDGLNSRRFKLAMVRCNKLLLPYIKSERLRQTMASVLDGFDSFWAGHPLVQQLPFPSYARLRDYLVADPAFEPVFDQMRRRRSPTGRHLNDPTIVNQLLDNIRDLYPHQEGRIGGVRPEWVMVGMPNEIAIILTNLEAHKLQGKTKTETAKIRKTYRSRWVGRQDKFKLICDVIRSVIPCPTVNRDIFFTSGLNNPPGPLSSWLKLQ